MANDKLTWQELRKAVAEQANTSEQEAGQFLNALLNGLVEGLKKDKQVKVKGLGNFSLKAVAPRKSVNIATGEAFTIEGYNKLTFSPETMLKENVEKRIEQPQTEKVMADINNDPLKKLGEQANEIIDILAELGQAVNPVTPPIVEPEEPEEPDTPEVPQEPEVPEEPEEPDTPDTPDTPQEPQEPEVPDTPQPTGKSHKWVCWLIAALVVLGIIGTGIYFRATLIQWWQCMQDCQPAVEEVVTDTVPTLEEPIVIPLANKPREYVNFIGIERVGENSRLAWIAYKYYAQKDLWVFIYEANRDIIKHPAHVLPGQYIRIPDLTEEYRNLYNPELRQLVDSLATKYLTVEN